MISPEVFYLHIQGEQRGPYTIPQIDHLLNSGLIAEETLYWREGLEQWQPVTSLVSLRRKVNPWGKRALYMGIAVVVLGVLQFFGSIALVGWRETNQHEYTEHAAYWRARDVVRGGGLPDGSVVQFHGESKAKVTMAPPAAAAVVLEGDVTLQTGETRRTTWSVPMTFDAKNTEWNGGPPQVLTP
jgi:hypothetical protein